MDELERLTGELVSRLFVEVEASGRHVHLTREQAQILFGHGLTPERPLSQPGQYLCRERVSLVGPKGEMRHVAVLGPERPEGQAELSLTDGIALGLKLPIRLSGDVKDSPGITLRGDKGELHLPCGAIAAQRHIHLPPEEAEKRGLKDRQTVKLKLLTERPVVFENVQVRVRPDFAPRAHIDYDEANACGFRKGDLGLIVCE